MAPRPALDRLRSRPSPEDWADDDLLTMREGAALFFPSGPFDAASLRIACRRGELPFVRACGRLYTTPRAIRAMKAPMACPSSAFKREACQPTRIDNLGALRRLLGT